MPTGTRAAAAVTASGSGSSDQIEPGMPRAIEHAPQCKTDQHEHEPFEDEDHELPHRLRLDADSGAEDLVLLKLTSKPEATTATHARSMEAFRHDVSCP